MPREGMLIQVDGSIHPWLGDQVPPFTLLIAVDDATGTVTDALFCEKEEAYTYFLLIQDRDIRHRGLLYWGMGFGIWQVEVDPVI